MIGESRDRICHITLIYETTRSSWPACTALKTHRAPSQIKKNVFSIDKKWNFWIVKITHRRRGGGGGIIQSELSKYRFLFEFTVILFMHAMCSRQQQKHTKNVQFIFKRSCRCCTPPPCESNSLLNTKPCQRCCTKDRKEFLEMELYTHWEKR